MNGKKKMNEWIIDWFACRNIYYFIIQSQKVIQELIWKLWCSTSRIQLAETRPAVTVNSSRIIGFYSTIIQDSFCFTLASDWAVQSLYHESSGFREDHGGLNITAGTRWDTEPLDQSGGPLVSRDVVGVTQPRCHQWKQGRVLRTEAPAGGPRPGVATFLPNRPFSNFRNY